MAEEAGFESAWTQRGKDRGADPLPPGDVTFRRARFGPGEARAMIVTRAAAPAP